MYTSSFRNDIVLKMLRGDLIIMQIAMSFSTTFGWSGGVAIRRRARYHIAAPLFTFPYSLYLIPISIRTHEYAPLLNVLIIREVEPSKLAAGVKSIIAAGVSCLTIILFPPVICISSDITNPFDLRPLATARYPVDFVVSLYVNILYLMNMLEIDQYINVGISSEV
ncbi:hypothetical protein Trydic_g3949 [Trypoxylus dichotomus]